jgi:hypothetical protein
VGRQWIESVAQLRSRLPPDLDQGVMGQMVSIHLDEPMETDECALCCTACGLQRPHTRFKRQPVYREEFFKVCPHCHGKPANWTHLVVIGQYDWQRLALAELAAAAPDPGDRGPP